MNNWLRGSMYEKIKAGKDISGRVDSNQEIHFNLLGDGDDGEPSNFRYQGIVGYLSLKFRRKLWVEVKI